MCVLLAVLNTLHFVHVVTHRGPLYVAALATHWSLAVGDGEGSSYKEWCSGCGAIKWSYEHCSLDIYLQSLTHCCMMCIASEISCIHNAR